MWPLSFYGRDEGYVFGRPILSNQSGDVRDQYPLSPRLDKGVGHESAKKHVDAQ